MAVGYPGQDESIPHRPGFSRLGIPAGLAVCLAALFLAAGCSKVQQPKQVSPFARGTTAYSNRDYAGAIKYFTQAIDRNPKLTSAYINRGNAYLALKRHLKALADFTRATKLAPKLAVAWHNRGLTLRRMGRIKAAVKDYTAAIKLDPNYAQAFNNRGYAFKQLKNYFRAVKDFSQALTLRPRFLIALNNRADAYLAWGKYDQAVQDYSRVIEGESGYYQVYYHRALAYEKLGKYHNAARDLKKVLELKPGDPPSRKRLAALEASGKLKSPPPSPAQGLAGRTRPTLAGVKTIPPRSATAKPGTKPVAKPGTKPGPKPRPKPTVKPATKPRPKPGLKPAVKPVPTVASRKLDIFTAARQGDLAQIRRAVRERPQSIGDRDTSGATALHRAAMSGQTAVVRYLITVGAEVNARDKQGHTPLYWAIRANRAAAAAVLARHGGRE